MTGDYQQDPSELNLSAIPDEELVRSTQHGQVWAFAEIVRRYQGKLLRYGRRFLRNTEDAEDAVQDAFLNAYRNIAGFRTDERFSPLYRIAHNAVTHDQSIASQADFLFRLSDGRLITTG